MNTDQIAEEAAEDILKLVVPKIRKEQAYPLPETISIIQSAIEKAYDAGKLDEGNRLGQLGSREICEWIEKYDRQSKDLDSARSIISDLTSRLKILPEIAGSCNCLTKTPEVKYHLVTCRYRQIIESHTAQGSEICECGQSDCPVHAGRLVSAAHAGETTKP